jgi:hypothetical protein
VPKRCHTTAAAYCFVFPQLVCVRLVLPAVCVLLDGAIGAIQPAALASPRRRALHGHRALLGLPTPVGARCNSLHACNCTPARAPTRPPALLPAGSCRLPVEGAEPGGGAAAAASPGHRCRPGGGSRGRAAASACPHLQPAVLRRWMVSSVATRRPLAFVLGCPVRVGIFL